MRRLLMFGILVCALSCIGVPAYAGTSDGGNLRTLQKSDMPTGFELESEPSVQPAGMTAVIDGDACTQRTEDFPNLAELAIARFRATGGNQTLMSEAVASFDSVGVAKTSYKTRAKGAKDAIKCGTVDVIQNGSSVATLTYKKLKFPKLGDQSYAVTVSGASGTTQSTTVVIRSGSDIAFVNLFGFEGEPTLKQLKAIARRAEKRLD